MTWADAAKILFGAGLGLLISWSQAWLTSRRQRKRAEKLLSIQLPIIHKAVKSLTEGKDPIGNRVMPTTELPHLNYFGVNELASLSEPVAHQVYELENAMKGAEISRKIASAYLMNQSSPEFQAHSILYLSYMESALKAITAIQKNPKCQKE